MPSNYWEDNQEFVEEVEEKGYGTLNPDGTSKLKLPGGEQAPTWGRTPADADPRFQYLGAKLEDRWKQEGERMEDVIGAPSVAEQQQNIGMAGAAQAGIGAIGSGNALGAMSVQADQAQTAANVANVAGQARGQEDIRKMQMMQDWANRRNRYIIEKENLFNTAQGADASAYIDRMRGESFNPGGMSKGTQVAVGQAGEMMSAVGAGMSYSDEKLKKDVTKIDSPLSKYSSDDPLKARREANAPKEPEEKKPDPYAKARKSALKDAMGSFDSLIRKASYYSDERLKKDKKSLSDMNLSSSRKAAAEYMSKNPGIMKSLASGRIDERQALYITAKEFADRGELTKAEDIRNIAARTPAFEKKPIKYARELEDRDLMMRERQARSNLAGMQPVYNENMELIGYRPGKGSFYREDIYGPDSIGDTMNRPVGMVGSKDSREIIRGSQMTEHGDPEDYRPVEGGGIPGMVDTPDMRREIRSSPREEIETIEPYKYRYNDKIDDVLGRRVDKSPRVGVMAQQVEQHNPELVESVNGYKAIKEDEALGKALASHAEVARNMSSLDSELSELEKKLEEKLNARA